MTLQMSSSKQNLIPTMSSSKTGKFLLYNLEKRLYYIELEGAAALPKNSK